MQSFLIYVLSLLWESARNLSFWTLNACYSPFIRIMKVMTIIQPCNGVQCPAPCYDRVTEAGDINTNINFRLFLWWARDDETMVQMMTQCWWQWDHTDMCHYLREFVCGFMTVLICVYKGLWCSPFMKSNEFSILRARHLSQRSPAHVQYLCHSSWSFLNKF